MKDWNPELYLKFNKERIQPAMDLLTRINVENPGKIIDIGCGPGNSTQILKQRWPDAKITGADNSPAMIQKAEAEYPDQQWILFDANKDTPNEKYDIVFSNAAIQWIPNHSELIKKFASILNDNGVLSIQMPLFFDMEIAESIAEVASQPKWSKATEDVEDLFTIHHETFYYDQLSKYFNTIEIWTTSYYHIMESHEKILEMVRSTGLKPYIDRIPEQDIQEFESLILKRLLDDYPTQENGKVLFPFKRLFLLAQKIQENG